MRGLTRADLGIRSAHIARLALLQTHPARARALSATLAFLLLPRARRYAMLAMSGDLPPPPGFQPALNVK